MRFTLIKLPEELVWIKKITTPICFNIFMLQGEPWHRCKKWELPALKAATINHTRRRVQRVLNTASFWILKKCFSELGTDVPLSMHASLNLHFIVWYCILAWCLTFWWQEIKQKKKAGGITPTEWPDLWNATWTEETSYTGRGTYDKRWRTVRGRDPEKLSCKRVVGSYIKFYSM